MILVTMSPKQRFELVYAPQVKQRVFDLVSAGILYLL